MASSSRSRADSLPSQGTLRSRSRGRDISSRPFPARSAAGSDRTGSRPPSSYVVASQEDRLPEVDDAYSHVSVFRTSHLMEVHVRSPSMKITRAPGSDAPRPLPVYDLHNEVRGTVLLDALLCSRPGRLSITMEGSFTHTAPATEIMDIPVKPGSSSTRRHVFLQSSQVLPVEGAIRTRRSSSRLRDTISTTVRAWRERRPSQASINSVLRPFPFSFDVPALILPGGEELPVTFASTTDGLGGTRARSFAERSEVAYKLITTWESDSGDDQLVVESPIVFEPDSEFESLDGRTLDPESWIEIPLHTDRPIPFKCAVALPDNRSFPRTASIPYYVVFTTIPRSPTLAYEILTDATISVTLLRQINIDMAPVSPSTTASSPVVTTPVSPASSFSDEASSFILKHKAALMKRVVTSAPPILTRKQARPPPPVERLSEEDLPQGFSEMRSIFMDIHEGFPKRPRARIGPGQQHPSLITHTALPDGLYRSKMQLNKKMSPSITWRNLSIKYYLDVSVVFGQDQTRIRMPIQIV